MLLALAIILPHLTVGQLEGPTTWPAMVSMFVAILALLTAVVRVAQLIGKFDLTIKALEKRIEEGDKRREEERREFHEAQKEQAREIAQLRSTIERLVWDRARELPKSGA